MKNNLHSILLILSFCLLTNKLFASEIEDIFRNMESPEINYSVEKNINIIIPKQTYNQFENSNKEARDINAKAQWQYIKEPEIIIENDSSSNWVRKVDKKNKNTVVNYRTNKPSLNHSPKKETKDVFSQKKANNSSLDTKFKTIKTEKIVKSNKIEKSKKQEKPKKPEKLERTFPIKDIKKATNTTNNIKEIQKIVSNKPIEIYSFFIFFKEKISIVQSFTANIKLYFQYISKILYDTLDYWQKIFNENLSNANKNEDIGINKIKLDNNSKKDKDISEDEDDDEEEEDDDDDDGKDEKLKESVSSNEAQSVKQELKEETKQEAPSPNNTRPRKNNNKNLSLWFAILIFIFVSILVVYFIVKKKKMKPIEKASDENILDNKDIKEESKQNGNIINAEIPNRQNIDIKDNTIENLTDVDSDIYLVAKNEINETNVESVIADKQRLDFESTATTNNANEEIIEEVVEEIIEEEIVEDEIGEEVEEEIIEEIVEEVVEEDNTFTYSPA